MKLAVFAFTRRGCQIAARTREVLKPEECRIFAPEKFGASGFEPYHPPLAGFMEPVFAWADEIVFIGSTGMAVRAIAPWVADKKHDPGVVTVDEGGHFVISLLSGHIGGANRLARQLAQALDAQPVVTTATDVNGKFSPDEWATRNGLTIESMAACKAVAAALLEGNVPMVCDFPIASPLPGGVYLGDSGDIGIYIGWRNLHPFHTTLRLIPKVLNLGIGCRRGVGEEQIAGAVAAVLGDIPLEAVRQAASIELKKDEPGLLAFCAHHGFPAMFYSAQELRQVPGDFPASQRVLAVTGVDNVCQRAAMAEGGTCIIEKTASGGVTVSVAQIEWEAVF